MPRRCVAAGCDTKSGMSYSLHGFSQNEELQKKWVRAVKRQRSNWDGPSSSSQLCSKHFEDHCFVTDGVRYRKSMGVPALKRLKPDAVPTLFPRSIDYLQGASSTPRSRPLSERWQERSVSILIRLFITTSNRKLTNQQV